MLVAVECFKSWKWICRISWCRENWPKLTETRSRRSGSLLGLPVPDRYHNPVLTMQWEVVFVFPAAFYDTGNRERGEGWCLSVAVCILQLLQVPFLISVTETGNWKGSCSITERVFLSRSTFLQCSPRASLSLSPYYPPKIRIISQWVPLTQENSFCISSTVYGWGVLPCLPKFVIVSLAGLLSI